MKWIIDRVEYVWNGIFSEVTVVEYISWWVIRGLLVYAAITCDSERGEFLFPINTLAMFTVSILRLISPKKSVIAKLSFRCQTLIAFIEFFGMFLGDYVNVDDFIPNYDWVLHAISGPVTVVAGYYFYLAIMKKEKNEEHVSCTLGAMFGCCFSFVFIVLWEFMEFFADFITGSENQAFTFIPNENNFIFKLLGPGKIEGNLQFPLWDTIIDMLLASITSFLCAFVLYVILRVVTKKRKLKKEQQELNLTEAASIK